MSVEVFCLNCAGTATGFSASDYSDVNDPVNVKLAALPAGSLGYYGSERTGGTALSRVKFGFEVRNEADTGMNAELGSLI